jgi:hypothetical protein
MKKNARILQALPVGRNRKSHAQANTPMLAPALSLSGFGP